MTLSGRLSEIQLKLQRGELSVAAALDDVINAFLAELDRRDREEREAAERSVGG